MNIEEFNDLVAYAEQQIGKTENKKAVVVVRTSKGNVYSNFFCPEEQCRYGMLEEMLTNSDTVVRQIVCMFNNGQLEVPSFELRTTLMRLDASNKDAELLLEGTNGLCTRRLHGTL